MTHDETLKYLASEFLDEESKKRKKYLINISALTILKIKSESEKVDKSQSQYIEDCLIEHWKKNKDLKTEQPIEDKRE